MTIRRMRGTGGSNGVSCRPSASCGVLAPRPSTKRPPDIECSVAAAIAMVAEAVVAEAIALGGDTDDHLAPRLQRHDGETDSWEAHAVVDRDVLGTRERADYLARAGARPARD
ncbi:MAG TPA: hypothetical protein VFV05_11285 [Methylomirabilota bacterium]|nr:hypothetical protein [Methylomirabilota bacterium]